MKKLLCLFLTVLLIASIFVACDTGDGGNTESPSETLAEKNTVTPSEKVTAEETVSAFGTESVPPTDKVTDTHTTAPTEKPTVTPTEEPTVEPTVEPTEESTYAPTEEPTAAPTEEPTSAPTEEPTSAPTEEPTLAPTEEPTTAPTEEPTLAPTEEPTLAPTEEPTLAPTEEPTTAPTEEPTLAPTEEPTSAPTEEPTSAPTDEPTSAPTDEPTSAPTDEPVSAPTEEPTSAPTEEPTSAPTEKPTEAPIPPASEERVLSFADTSARVSLTASSQGKQVWSANGITLTNIGHVADYADPVRLYKNTAVTITCADMSVLVFNCFNEDYASALLSSLGEGAVADGKVVTLVLPAATDKIAFTCASQIRLDSLTVNPSTSGGGDPEPPVEDPTTDPTTPPEEPEINYGTLENPVTTTYAYGANSTLRNEEFSASPFYVKGTVTAIESTVNYYKNVYITDGITNLHIYTINMGDGVTGFEVGDVIVAYGYFVNYNDDIGLATYKPDPETRIYVYAVKVEGGEGGDTPPSSSHTYTDFTSDEKAMFTDTFGFVIPFIPNDEYYVEEYELEGESGINFYAFGNTSAEFNAYRALFSSYTNDGTDTDEYDDICYYYSKGDVYVDMCYYLYDDAYIVDVYVYVETEGGNGESGGNTTPSDLITNDGAGLPEDDGDGIFDVDFTKGQYVQNVTDQGYYLDGCPTTGTPAVLVIPVDFSDVPAGEGYTTDNIEKIFNGTDNDTTYHSVHDYFFMSSYETLDLQITVLDEWFRPANTSTYYANETYDYYGSEMAIGDQLVLDEALAYLEGIMDLSVFDSDGNSVIDAVVMVTTLEINSDVDFYWAYRYWNVYTDDEGYYFEYDGVSANDYAWIPYDFMFEGYDEETGEVNYDKSNPLNPYTFIHEFGHVLGADDYYNTSYTEHPLGGADMMDAMQGDHNPYTKFNYGWLTFSKLITTKNEVTVTLDAFVNSGDTVIIANNWDEKLGAYQEYFVIMYYTNTGLNSGEGGYFSRDGIVVYHVNASLYAQSYGDETYYDVYFNNTDPSDQYGTEENLIEFVKHPDGEDMIYTYVEGDSLPSISDDAGNALGYTFTVDSLTQTSATLTFKALN